MVTNSQDYEELLWEIQNNSAISRAKLLPKDEKIFNIDLNERTIEVPEFLSVAQDHQSETIYFKFDRFFGNVDLTTKVCIIQYKNANGDEYIYPVPYYDTETLSVNRDKVLIPWCIQGAATAYAGTISFSVRFFSLDANKHITYDLNTIVASGKILEGQNWELNNISDSQFTLDNDFLLNLQRIEEAQDGLKLYWIDV